MYQATPLHKPPLRVTFRDIYQDLLQAAGNADGLCGGATDEVGCFPLAYDDELDDTDSDGDSDVHNVGGGSFRSRTQPRSQAMSELRPLLPGSDMNLSSPHILDMISDVPRVSEDTGEPFGSAECLATSADSEDWNMSGW